MSPTLETGAEPSDESLIDRCVQGFEEALNHGSADLAAFLPPSDHPAHLGVLVELIRVDLDRRWQSGQPRLLEFYRERFPQTFQSDSVKRVLGFEEYRVRRRAGQTPLAHEYQDRLGIDIPAVVNGSASEIGTVARPVVPPSEGLSSLDATVRKQIENLVDVFRARPDVGELFESIRKTNSPAAERWSQALDQMPKAGARFLDFHLIAELGSGSFGRVFLARQVGLAERFVALKIAADLDHESQTLAQLQHTNIVPIYSVHRAGALQAVCMPYFGATTLAHVYREVTRNQYLPNTGKILMSTVRESQKVIGGSEGEQPASKTGPTSVADNANEAETGLSQYAPFRVLGGLSYVESVLWLAARIAEGLAHAHDRGILHRDLKPANILLTDDGQPMLLDFNLAEDRKESDALVASVGGTLPYMSPEQLEVFKDGKGRLGTSSDLYSLGVILFELLTGQAPFPAYRDIPLHESLPRMLADRQQPPPPLRRLNPHISPAIDAIVRHCLQPQPAERYYSAQDLREDLERQLNNQPLRHTPEASFWERCGKFRRRHPRLLSVGSVVVGAACIMAILTFGLVLRGKRLAELGALETAAGLRREKHDLEFRLMARSAPAQSEQALRQGLEALAPFGVLEDADWTEREPLKLLPASRREKVREDIGEVLWLCSHASILHATFQSSSPRQEDLAQAETLLERALACYDPEAIPQSLIVQQAIIARLRGEAQRAVALEAQARSIAPRLARDLYRLAFSLAEQGQFRQALVHVEDAARKEPDHYNTWFLRGLCLDALSRDAEAIASYSTCMALRPTFFGAYFNRGLARLRLKQFALARQDFDAVIDLRPDFPGAFFNRALALMDGKEWKKAEEDLTRALELGSDQTRIYFTRAGVRERLGNRKGAKEDRERGWQEKPRDPQSWVARGLDRMAKDPAGAIADFDQALALDPRSLPALQNKAFVLVRFLKKVPESIKVLDRAITLYPDDARPRSGRGVLLARLGQIQAALNDAEAALVLDASASTQYQVAGIYALASEKDPKHRDTAFRLLTASLKQGFGQNYLAIDPDLNPLRGDPRFARLLAAWRGL